MRERKPVPWLEAPSSWYMLNNIKIYSSLASKDTMHPSSSSPLLLAWCSGAADTTDPPDGFFMYKYVNLMCGVPSIILMYTCITIKLMLLKRGAHVKQVEEKAGVQMQAMSRLTQSTWGATFKKSKLIYSAIVRPALTYGSSIWAEYGRTGNTLREM